MDLVVYDDEDRRYVPAHLVVLLAVVMTVVGAGAALGLTPAPRATSIGGSTAPQSATGPDDAGRAPACVDEALRRADALLARSRRLSSSLAEDTALLNRLRVGLATAPDAVDQTIAALRRSSSERERLADEAAAYERWAWRLRWAAEPVAVRARLPGRARAGRGRSRPGRRGRRPG